MSKRENKRIRQLERRLAVLEKQQTTGCACRSKQEVTVEPKVQAKPKTRPCWILTEVLRPGAGSRASTSRLTRGSWAVSRARAEMAVRGPGKIRPPR